MAQTEMNLSGANSNQRPLSYDDLLRWLVIVALLALTLALKEVISGATAGSGILIRWN